LPQPFNGSGAQCGERPAIRGLTTTTLGDPFAEARPWHIVARQTPLAGAGRQVLSARHVGAMPRFGSARASAAGFS
jgi:hypothetical protein